MSWRGNCVKIFLENSHDVREGRKDENNMKDEYVAYVGTYTHGSSIGIHLYDVNVEEGTLTERKVIPVNNSSHIARSLNGKYLYSIADEGVAVFAVEDDGDLTPINKVDIDGMRGCYLSVDKTGRYLFVAGYHDGKVTVVHTHKDGRLGSLMDGVFHKGLGSVAERNFRPHVTCTRRMPDNRFVLSVDNGIDQVKIYRFNDKEQRLVQVDAIRCELESAPRHFRYSKDGKFIYLMYELKKAIDVYTYKTGDRAPVIEKIQTISTTSTKKPDNLTAACAMRMSADQKYIYCTNAGENTISVYKRDEETGLLTMICCLPISGAYPKDVAVFPDGRHIASVNHDSGTISFFKVDYEKGLLVMSGRSIPVNEPNCCAIVKIGD